MISDALSRAGHECWYSISLLPLFSPLPTYDVEVTRHLFGAKAVGDLTDVVAAVLEPQVGNGEAGDATRPAGVCR